MCGHVGVMGVLTPKLVTVFQDLINFDMVRGYDSTGVGFVNLKNIATVVKDTVLPYELLLTPEYQKFIKDKNVCLMGHNRAATKGNVIAENAHPFQHGHITMAHNGTLTNPHRLPDYFANQNKTDSEAICSAISKLGVVAAWKLVVGAATIVYWNAEDHSFNILSNDERPFHFCYVNGGTALAWASEEPMLKAALMRRGVEIDNKGEIIKPFKNRHYKVQFGKKGVLSVTKTDLEPFSVPAPLLPRVSSGVWPERGGHQHGGYVRIKGKKKYIDTTNVLPFDKTQQPKKALTELEFHALYKKCVFCYEPLANEFKEAVIIDSRSAACEMCAKTAAKECVRLVN